MMFTNAKNIQPDLVGKVDFLEKILHPLNGAEGESGGCIGNHRSKAIDANLHFMTPKVLDRFNAVAAILCREKHLRSKWNTVECCDGIGAPPQAVRPRLRSRGRPRT